MNACTVVCPFVFLCKYKTIYLSILWLRPSGAIPTLWLLKQCFYEHFYSGLPMHIQTHPFGIFNTLVLNYRVITGTYLHSAFWDRVSVSHCGGFQWSFIMVLICISMVINDIGHLSDIFKYRLSIRLPSSVKCPHKSSHLTKKADSISNLFLVSGFPHNYFTKLTW